MDIHEVRRAALRAYIRQHLPRDGHANGNVSAFAYKVGMKQSQIADMLDGRKSFGEKVARKIERQIRTTHDLPDLDLDRDVSVEMLNSERTKDASSGREQLSAKALRFAADWEQLPKDAQGHIAGLVRTMLIAARKQQADEAGKNLRTKSARAEGRNSEAQAVLRRSGRA